MDHAAADDLLGAYALDACDDAENAAIESHLAQCEHCRECLAELEASAEWLGVLESAAPPQELRARTLGEAARVEPGKA